MSKQNRKKESRSKLSSNSKSIQNPPSRRWQWTDPRFALLVGVGSFLISFLSVPLIARLLFALIGFLVLVIAILKLDIVAKLSRLFRIVIVVMTAVIILGPSVYSAYSYWTRPLPKLQFTADASPFPEHEMSTLGGLKWDGKTRAIHVFIQNIGQNAAENINVALTFNVSMDQIVQITSKPNIQAAIDAPEIGLLLKNPDNTGLKSFTPHQIKFSPTIHVICQRMERNETLRFVVTMEKISADRLGATPPKLEKVTGTYEGRYGEDVTVLNVKHI